jgi:hypothetical protein
MYLVTIKLPRNPYHNPKSKVTGICPVAERMGLSDLCTDATGEHHTYMDITSASITQAIETAHILGFSHVTRVE